MQLNLNDFYNQSKCLLKSQCHTKHKNIMSFTYKNRYICHGEERGDVNLFKQSWNNEEKGPCVPSQWKLEE